MPFYKLINGEMLEAPNFVHGPGFSLLNEQKSAYTYPVDGWYWFDAYEEAKAFLYNISFQKMLVTAQANFNALAPYVLELMFYTGTAVLVADDIATVTEGDVVRAEVKL